MEWTLTNLYYRMDIKWFGLTTHSLGNEHSLKCTMELTLTRLYHGMAIDLFGLNAHVLWNKQWLKGTVLAPYFTLLHAVAHRVSKKWLGKARSHALINGNPEGDRGGGGLITMLLEQVIVVDSFPSVCMQTAEQAMQIPISSAGTKYNTYRSKE